jgi:hypothetical protein
MVEYPLNLRASLTVEASPTVVILRAAAVEAIERRAKVVETRLNMVVLGNNSKIWYCGLRLFSSPLATLLLLAAKAQKPKAQTSLEVRRSQQDMSTSARTGAPK